MRGLIEAHRRGVVAHLVTTTRADADILIEHGADPQRVTPIANGVRCPGVR